MRQILVLAGVLSFAIISGCASIVGDSTETIAISSTPDGATFVIRNKQGRVVTQGQTPSSVTLAVAGNGYFEGERYSISMTKAGYDPRTVIVDSTPSGWYLLGNAVFGGLIGWLIVDPLTGKMYTLSPDEVNGDLFREQASLPSDVDKGMNVLLATNVPDYMRAAWQELN